MYCFYGSLKTGRTSLFLFGNQPMYPKCQVRYDPSLHQINPEAVNSGSICIWSTRKGNTNLRREETVAFWETEKMIHFLSYVLRLSHVVDDEMMHLKLALASSRKRKRHERFLLFQISPTTKFPVAPLWTNEFCLSRKANPSNLHKLSTDDNHCRENLLHQFRLSHDAMYVAMRCFFSFMLHRNDEYLGHIRGIFLLRQY